MQTLLIKPYLLSLVKTCYDQRSVNQVKPLELLTSNILQEYLPSGALSILLNLTRDPQNYNYVSGYDICRHSLWPVLLQTLDSHLSFVFSTTNYQQFHFNYQVARDFIHRMKERHGLADGEELLRRFNLHTYLGVVTMEVSERQGLELDKAYESTNNADGREWHRVSVGLAAKVLGDGCYIQEVGDKMIKFAVQLVVRHLNWVMDKINEKKSMATERVLHILEDLG